MSNPFAGRVPAIIPFSFVTDANGNAKVPLRPRASFWWAGKAVAKLNSGSAIWEVAAGNVFSGWGRGQRAEIAGLMVAPGDTIVLSVIGGPANTPGAGTLVGEQGASMHDVVDAFSSNPNTIAIDTTSGHTVIGTITVGAGATVSQNFLVPVGTQSIGFMSYLSGPNNTPNVVTITGHTTLMQYVNIAGADVGAGNTSLSNGGPQWADFDATDTSVDCGVTAHSTSPAVIDILASPLVMSVDVGQLFGEILSVQSSNTPAPWQAPREAPLAFNPTVALNATVVIIAAVAGKTVYLFDLDYELDTGVGGSFLAWQDTNNNPVSQDAGSFAAIRPYHFSGAPLPVGLGLQLKNSGAGPTTVRGHVTYSQR